MIASSARQVWTGGEEKERREERKERTRRREGGKDGSLLFSSSSFVSFPSICCLWKERDGGGNERERKNESEN